jgi:protein involved in polysaccharide export with SLBB domain
MNRPFVSFICLVCFCGLLGSDLFAQSPAILSKIPTDVLEQISDEDRLIIQGRVEGLSAQGLSEQEIFSELKNQGLLPEDLILAVEGGSTSGGTNAEGVIEQPETDAALPEPPPVSEPEPVVVIPPQSPLPPTVTPIYGQHVFQQGVQFNKALSSAPGFDYLIAPGDIFNVNAWGCSEYTKSLVVGTDGAVQDNFLGKVYVAGLTYGKAREILISRLRSFLSRCSQLEVFIGSSQRTVSVNIVGEVKQPGSYRINAAMPAFNALFEAGGVTNIGSVRNIIIRRGNKVIKTLDIYEYISGGENDPVYLQNNDFVFVPVQEKVVHISGPVRRPMKYELKADEDLQSLLNYAGGLQPNALLSSARLVRTNEKEETQLDFVLSSYLTPDGMDFSLKDGDHLIIRPKKQERENTVTISGQVSFPDTYQLKPGDRVENLIERAGGLESKAYLARAYVIRLDSVKGAVSYLPIDLSRLDDPQNNLLLQFADVVQVFSMQNFEESRFIEVQGRVSNTGTVRLSRDMNLKDLLYQVGGMAEGAYIRELELYRYFNPMERGINNLGTGEEEIIRIPIERDWQNSNLADSLRMWDYRKLTVRSEDEYIRTGEIIIKGLVNSPGTFMVVPNMTLKDVLYMAKGLRLEADYESIELSRVVQTIDASGELVPVPIVIKRVSTVQDWRNDSGLDSIPVNSFDQVFVRRNPDFLLQESVFIKGEIRSPGEYHKLAKNERMSSLVSRAGGINEIAYLEGARLKRPGIGVVSVKLDDALRNPGQSKDILLLEGDTLIIPALQEVVTIRGNVFKSPTKVVFEKGRRSFRYYVRQAGGFESKSKKKASTITYMDGRVKRARGILGIKFYPRVKPGSTLEVPRKQKKQKEDEKEKKEREPIDLQALLSGAVTILTFYLLIDRSIE